MTASVAMTTYNGGDRLCCQLDSVLCQLRPDDELVISDDGSTDGTKERLDALCASDARVRVLNGPKQGVIANFQNAIAACRGDVIFLCDQDDAWDADKLASVLERFEQSRPLLVMHDARVTDGDGTLLDASFFQTRGTRTGLLKNLWKNSYIGCCMAFSKDLVPWILPFPDGIPMHDQWIGLQAERHGQVVLINRPLMSYIRHGDNVSPSSHGSLATMLRQRMGMLSALMKTR